jgi:ATP-binding cassette subfamily B protein
MQKNSTALQFLFNSTKPFKFYLGLHFFVVLYNAIDLALWPYISKLLIDKISITPRELVIDEVWPYALLLIIFTAVPNFVWRIADYAWAKLTPLLKKKIASESMEYVMGHSHSFFQNSFSGSLTNKVRDLIKTMPALLETILYSFLHTILALIFAFIALFSIHKAFAFGLILWALLFIFMAIRAAKLTNRMSLNIARQQTKIMGNIADVFGNVSNVKFFANSHYESQRIKLLQNKFTQLFERRGFFLVRFFTLHGTSFILYYAACIAFLVWLYAQGQVTLGDFLMLFTINNFIIHLMWQSANAMRNFLEDLGTANQALSIINKPLGVVDGKEELVVSKGEIIFEDVKFSYHASRPLFEGKSLTISPGQKVGLVGHSGGGKTSFVNLILRLFDIDSGRILIDGQDISKVTQDSLRRSIAVIPQDTSLFHRSLCDNIAYGAPRYSKKSEILPEVIAAAKNAHAHEFIMKMPQAYNSLVGERGVKLSGGQRQRIAIARAFLKNAPILILDEATSALDSKTEGLIQDSLKHLMEHKTTLVIAHRLSTLKMMDRILVLEGGKIIEDGSHEELLALGGVYKSLWDSQSGGVLTYKVKKFSAVRLSPATSSTNPETI